VFGGRLKFMITGSAPIASEVLRFFMIVLGCDVREGYGQTETTAGTFFTEKGEREAGHVGGVNPAVELKLVDIPEMNYSSSNTPPTGEICLRGEPIFTGYYKDEKNTKETIDKDGWIHTGDVGMILPNGALKIIDRKKNIFKLSQGEYIAPEKIENIYLRCPLAAEVFLYGDSLQSYNVAIVVPNKDILMKVAHDKGIKKSFEELCEDKAVMKMMFDQLTQQGKHDGLLGFELAKKIRLHPTSFGSYGIFTSTLKLQRHTAKQVFEKVIAEMYKEPL
jgi:long-chain acyl-CoA synthetase